ncbi:uncharacterized protein LOC119286013 [Triticum dicoccoides]|uniref:uncharacterized protein LOC119286013 n=2 Tax=Triticum dicoccoides TaxID=85692 RepID=UPI00188DE503|nr:uncharacterized protein LOC119286013 [Triticum dicoccoides]
MCLLKRLREEMAIDEAELEPLEFAEKMHTQRELQQQKLEMLVQIRKHNSESQSVILETLQRQLESADFDTSASIFTPEQIQGIVEKYSSSHISRVAPVETVRLAPAANIAATPLSIPTQAAGLLAVVFFTLFHHHEADRRCAAVRHWLACRIYIGLSMSSLSRSCLRINKQRLACRCADGGHERNEGKGTERAKKGWAGSNGARTAWSQQTGERRR